MLVKEYKSARTFLDDYETILLEQEAISQLVLYSAYHGCQNIVCGQENNPETVNTDYDAASTIYGAVLDNDQVTLLFCNVLPYNLVIYAVKPETAVLASKALAEYLGIKRITITGIYAEQEVCQSFMDEFKKNTRCSFAQRMSIDIMELRELNEITPIEGTHRLTQPEEAKLVAEWMIEFQMESLASEMDYEAALERAVKLIQEQKIYFYENKEQNVVTMAVAARKLKNGTAITYIFTPEEYRGKGYAAANIYYLSKELLEQGNQFCTLFVDKNNPLSSRAYEKVGYKSVGDIYEYKVIPMES
jgi:predicted GNAT family acetyltransferase